MQKQDNYVTEYFYMIPEEISVRDMEAAIRCVPMDRKEIWIELDLMEIMLQHDSLIFENMLDTFTEEGDRAFLAEKGVKRVYAASYDTRDGEAVKEILEELHRAFGGFMASDTEDLTPIFPISDLPQRRK